MRSALRLGLAFMIVLLLAVGSFALANQQRKGAPFPLLPDASSAPVVISGDEIGFRVEGHKGGVPVGRFVVKVDGKCVEPLPPPPSPRYVK